MITKDSVTVSTSMMQLPVDLCDPQLKKDKPELGKKKAVHVMKCSK